MGLDLFAKQVLATYDSLLKVGDNDTLTGTPKRISDGRGNDSPIWLGTTRIGIGLSPESGVDLQTNIGKFGSVITTSLRIDGSLTDSLGSAGSENQVLISTGSATRWASISAVSGVSGTGTTNTIPLWTSGTSIGNSLITQSGSTIDINGKLYADLIQLSGGTGDQATLSWNADEETIDIIQNGATLQVGQEIQIHCKNQTGATIPDGTPVYVTGTLGASGRLTIAPMIANGTIEAKYFIGVTTEPILNGEDGKVTSFGKIRGLNTSVYSEGQTLWVSSTNPGLFQTTRPIAPNLDLEVAIVINSSVNNGTIFVRSNIGHYLGTAHDVNISSVAENDLLVYKTNRWVNTKSIGDLSAANLTLTGYLRGPEVFVIDPAAYGDKTGLVQILGDLRVDGETTTINSTNISVSDKNITIAKDAVTAGDANGAGITIAGANATLTYFSATDDFTFNKSVNAAGFVGDLTGNADTADALSTARNIALTGSVLGNADFDGSGDIIITTTTNHNHDDLYYTETESDDLFVNVDGDTMTGSLVINANGIGATINSAQNTGLVVSGGNNSGTIAEFKFSTTKAIINTSGGGYFLGDISIGKTTAATTKLDVDGVITATDGNSTNWNDAYNYSQVGHLPLAGGTLSGRLTINQTGGGTLRLQNNDTTNTQFQTLGRLEWYNQDASGFGPQAAAIIEAQAAGTSGQHANLLFKTIVTTEGADATTSMTLDTSANLSVVGNVTGANLNVSNWDAAFGWGDHADAGYVTDITSQTDPKYLRSDESDTMTGSLTIDANGVGLDVSSSQNTGLIVNGGNNSTIIAEFKFGTTKAIINTSGGGYFAGNISIGKTTAATTALDVEGVITATDGNSTNWNAAYDYSQIGHLPLTGGTLSGDLIIDKANASILLYDPNTQTTNAPQIRFNTANNQGVKLLQNEFDSELPIAGYGLVLTADDDNTQFPTTGTLSFVVHGEIYAGGTTSLTTKKVWHAGDFTATNVSNWDAAYGWGDHADAGYLTDITTQTDPKYLRSDESDTMNGSLTIDANGVGLSVNSAQNTGLIVNGGNNSTIISEFKFGTTKAIINTSGGGYFLGDIGVGITSPTNRLHVYHPTTNVIATIESGDTAAHINLKDNASDTYGVLLSATGNDFHVSTGVAEGGALTERLRISGSTGVITADGGTSTNWNTAYNYSQVGHLPLSGGAVNGNVSITGTNGAVAFVVNSTHTPSVNANRYGAQINFDISDAGAALTADRVYAALDINATSNVSGGDLSNEARIYGINANVIATSDEDIVLGILGVGGRQGGAGQTANTSVFGIEGVAYTNAGVGNSEVVTELVGLYGYSYASNSDGTNPNVGNSYGVLGKYLNTSGGLGAIVSNAYGGYFEVENDIGTITNAYGVRAVIDRDGGTTQNGYLFYGDFQGTIAGNKYGLWIAGEANNYLSGNVGIGVTSPTTKLDVNGVITATGGNSTEWNTGYDYSQVGHLPLTGGTLSDSLVVNGNGVGVTITSSQNTGLIVSGGNNSGIISEFKFGTTKAIINTSGGGYFLGDLGIGVTAPAAKIHAFSAGTANVQEIVAVLGSTSTRPVLQFSENTAGLITSGMSLEYNGNGSGDANYMVINSVANVPRFVVMSGGNVGVGTIAPSAKIHAVGTIEEVIRVESGATGAIHFFNGTTRTGILGYSNGTSIATAADADDMVLRSETGHKLHLSISSVVGATLTSTGFGIGTISPSRPLEVNGSAYIAGEFLASSSGLVRINQYDNGLNGAGEMALYTLAGTGWNTGDGLGRIRFYTVDTSGIGVRDVAKIEAISENGDGATTTTMSGALAFYTSPYNANVAENMRLSSAGNLSVVGNITGAEFYGGGANITGVNATLLDGIDSSSFLRSDADDTMTGSLTINANGVGLSITSAQNTGLVVSGGNNSTIISEFKFGTTKAVINTSGGGYFLGNIGVGLTAPTAKIHTFETNNLYDPQIIVATDTTSVLSYMGIATNKLKFYRNVSTGVNFEIQTSVSSGSSGGNIVFMPNNGEHTPTEKMRLTTTGNLGIGTDAPEGLLHISSSTSGDAIVIIEADTDNDTEGDIPQLWFRADGGINESAIINNDNRLEFVNNVSSGGGIAFLTGATNNYGLTAPATGASVKMLIETNGNVGIGTTNIGTEANLHLGAKSTTEGGQLVLQKATSYTYDGHIDVWQDSLRILSGTGGTTSGAAVARFDLSNNSFTSYGDILPAVDNTGVIGNTAYTWADGQFTNLSVNSTLTVASTLNVRSAIDLADSDILRFGSSDDFKMYYDGTANEMEFEMEATCNQIRIHDNGTTRFTFARSTGTFSATGDVIAYSTSDKQLKDNLTTIPNALDKVKAIGGYEFDWNEKQDVHKGHDIGVVAQEIEAILPELVTTRDNGYKAVKYEKLVAVLIEAVKELSAEVEQLKKQK